MRYALLVLLAVVCVGATNTTACDQATTCQECLALQTQGELCGFFTWRNETTLLSACMPGNATGPFLNESSLPNDGILNSASFEFGFCCSDASTCRECNNHNAACGFRFSDSACVSSVHPNVSSSCNRYNEAHYLLGVCTTVYDPFIVENMTDGETVYGHLDLYAWQVASVTISAQVSDQSTIAMYVSLTDFFPGASANDLNSTDGWPIVIDFSQNPYRQCAANPHIHAAFTCMSPRCAMRIVPSCVAAATSFNLKLGAASWWWLVAVMTPTVLSLCCACIVKQMDRHRRYHERLILQRDIMFLRNVADRVGDDSIVSVTVIPPRKRTKSPRYLDVFLEDTPTVMLPVLGPQSLEALLSRADDQPIVTIPSSTPPGLATPPPSPGLPASATLEAPGQVTPPMPRVGSVDSLASAQSAGAEARLNTLQNLEQLWIAVRIVHDDGPPYMSAPLLPRAEADKEQDNEEREDAPRDHRPEPSAVARGSAAAVDVASGAGVIIY